MWEITNLRKEYKECNLNHVFDEYSTNILLMRKKGRVERMIAQG